MPTSSIRIACVKCWRRSVFQVPESKMRVITRRRRRRLRHQGLAIRRASPDAVGGAQAGAAGEMDVRAFRSRDGRRAWSRQHRRHRAWRSTRDNKFVGAAAHMLANIGAYVGSDRNLLSPFGMIGTVLRRVPYSVRLRATSSGFFRTPIRRRPIAGAGRPEAIYLIERLIDDAARELDVDRIELRRINMLPPSSLPYQSPLGPYYDCGEFEKNLDLALKLADVDGFAGRRQASARNAANCVVSGSSTRSNRPRGRSNRSMPRFASIRAVPRCC